MMRQNTSEPVVSPIANADIVTAVSRMPSPITQRLPTRSEATPPGI